MSIAEMFDLRGQAAVVTGAAQGIGRAVAMRLSEAGAGVVVADIDDKAARATATELAISGRKAASCHADVSTAAGSEEAVAAALREFGRLDILVNNAGVFSFIPALDITEETWNRSLDVNLKSAMFCSRAAALAMKQSGRGGRIINVASMAGLSPQPSMTCYSVSKAGMVMLTRSLAKEWAGYGIRVNAVAPGIVSTEGLSKLFGVESGLQSTETFRAVADQVPLGRLGEPDDVARVTLFLASRAAEYMTGATVVVDGGWLVR
ncbi:MAG: SDR family oxidoreductase [Chloroflexi bacterium]|nr:SDR family oxidoreductase [Chloroflexota bacterium]